MSLSVANFIIDNASGQAVRQDIEACLLALQGLSAESGSDLAESKCVQGMWFLRSDTKEVKIKKSTLGFTTVGNIDQPNLGLLPRSGGTSAPMTGQFLANSGGLASAPDIAFDGDIDTGLYRVSSDILGVSCGGSNVFQFTSTTTTSLKEISISTSNQDAYLNINTNSNSYSAIIDLSSDTTSVGQDFGFRFLRAPGSTGDSLIHHRSTSNSAGSLILKCQAGTSGNIVFQTGGTPSTSTSSDIDATSRWKINYKGGIEWEEDNSQFLTGQAFQKPIGTGYILARGIIGRRGTNAGNNSQSPAPGLSNPYNFYWNGSALACWIDQSDVGTVDITSSDYRIKKNITTQTELGIDKIKQLRPVNYEYTDYGVFKGDGIAREGFIAHEVAEVIPSAVDGEKDGEAIQSLNMDAIVSVLTKALQEAVAKIETLEAKVAALEA